MGFWPFGREPADVEIVSRVVTATAKNGFRVRAKLTLHFLAPEKQSEADVAADQCAIVATTLLRDAPDHSSVIGAEARLSSELTARYSAVSPKVRAVELASVHVVGDPALSHELRRAVGRSSEVPGAGPSPTPYPGIATVTGSTPSSVPPMRRRASSQIRSLQSLLMPPGTPPAVMGQFIAPNVRDAAVRILVAYLRAHDLVGVRHVVIDEGSAEMLATLVPASDAPPGQYEQSRATELQRWQGVLGDAAMAALQHEVRVAALYLVRQAFAAVELMPALADAVLDGVYQAAYGNEAGMLREVTAIPPSAPADFALGLASRMTTIAGTSDDAASIAAAMAPLVGTVEEDLKVSAMIIKASSGGS